jgi:3'-5' exoribonuclease
MPANKKAVAQRQLDDIAAPQASGGNGARSREEAIRIVPLAELCEGQEADFFALLSDKQELKTRDGKPYFRVTFRDARREVGFPIWSDSPLAEPCRSQWSCGQFYKMRAVLRQSNYGLQLEIKKIRQVENGDEKDGFDPLMCQPVSRFDPIEMFAEMMNIVESRIADKALRKLVSDILEQNREQLLQLPAAKKNHHACVSGYLEHVLNVVRTCCHLADKYGELYDDLDPPLNKDVIVAGAVLHDIGKLRELAVGAAGADYTTEGCLIGHVLQGRDIVREAAIGRKIDPETLLRLEHLIISHHRLAEFGAPKPPMTPEAIIVHYADDLDAKLNMMVCALNEDEGEGVLTSKRNSLFQHIFRGGM